MRVEIDNENHCGEFIRLNESWIEEHFSLEEVDRKLAEDPFRIVGGRWPYRELGRQW